MLKIHYLKIQVFMDSKKAPLLLDLKMMERHLLVKLMLVA